MSDAPQDPRPGSPPAPDGRTYEEAAGRIEQIIQRLDSGDAGLRETLDLVREGRGLVEYCAAELDAVSRGLEELNLDELVRRLEGGENASPEASQGNDDPPGPSGQPGEPPPPSAPPPAPPEHF